MLAGPRATAPPTQATDTRTQDETPLPWLPNPLRKIRAIIMYTLYGYDQSIWDRLRNPLWYILTAMMMFPRFGVPQAWFTLLLIMRDKGDEFQCSDFIIGFKGMQFLGVGAIPAVLGAFRLFFCTAGRGHRCEGDSAPGVPFWELAAFGMQIVLVWTAFAFLPFSERKGAARFKRVRDSDDDTVPSCCGLRRHPGRGAHLLKWLLYDLFVFLASGALLVLALVTERSDVDENGLDSESHETRQTYYWMRVTYGLLSVPWIFFKVPLAFTLTTHAKPTGYTRAGRTVALAKKAKPKTDVAEEDDEESQSSGSWWRMQRRAEADEEGLVVVAVAPVASTSGSDPGAPPPLVRK